MWKRKCSVFRKSCDHVIDKLGEAEGDVSSPQFTLLSSLMVIGNVEVEMHLFSNVTRSLDSWVPLLGDCNQFSLGENLARVDGHSLVEVEIEFFFEYSIVLLQIWVAQLLQIEAKWAGITNLGLLHIGK